MKRYYKEFPSIAIPAFLQTSGWEDHSWHNDATAHSQCSLEDGSGYVVWVAHDEVAMREPGEWKKFLVEFQPDIAEWIEEGRVILYDGDDEVEAQTAVLNHMLKSEF